MQHRNMKTNEGAGLRPQDCGKVWQGMVSCFPFWACTAKALPGAKSAPGCQEAAESLPRACYEPKTADRDHDPTHMHAALPPPATRRLLARARPLTRRDVQRHVAPLNTT